MVVVRANCRRGSADQGNVVRRHVMMYNSVCQNSQLVLNSFWNPQQVHKLCGRRSSGSRSVRPPHSEPTGVDAPGEPERRRTRRFHSPAGSAPVRPLASAVWPTVQSDGSDVSQRSIATRYVERASAIHRQVAVNVDAEVASRQDRSDGTAVDQQQ